MLRCYANWSTMLDDIDSINHCCIQRYDHEGPCICHCGEKKTNKVKSKDKKGILTPEKLDVKK